MESTNPFAQMPSTPEPIIAQVRRQLATEDGVTDVVPPALLDQLADQTVRELWNRPVRTFVPVLALRQARELLRAQTPTSPEPGERRNRRLQGDR